MGLFVAIPAVIAFNFFQRTVRTRMAQIDSVAHLVLALARPASAPTASSSPPPPPLPPRPAAEGRSQKAQVT